jgi:hypothetical protein
MAHVKKADQPIVDSILTALDSNPRAVMKAIVILGRNQTEDELTQEATLQHNGLGFTGTDARYGTYLYHQILAGQSLSQKTLDGARKMAKKYARTQLLAAAKNKQEHSK